MDMKPIIWLLLGAVCCLTVTESDYIGCYKDAGQYRHYSRSPGNYDPNTLTISQCQGLCRTWQHNYGAMADSSFCFCADELSDRSNLADDGLCISQCPDGSTDKCGTLYYVAVYGTSSIKGLSLAVKAPSSGIVEIFNPMKFAFSSSTSDVTYSLDFGDGAGKTKKNATDQEVKTFSLPGEYIATVYGELGSDEAKKYSVKVLSQSPAKNINMACPPVVAVSEEFICNASVRSGSHMKVSIDWKDDNNDSFPVADSLFRAAGPAIPNVETDEMNSNSTGGTVYLMPDSEFLHEGILYGFEYYSTALSGGAEILILRPECDVNKIYCHKTKTCESSCNVPYGSVSCSSPNLFCSAKGVCSDSCSISRTVSTDTKYKVIQVFTISPLKSNSYGYYEIESLQYTVVKPGDILGYKALGSVLLRTRPTRVGEIGDLNTKSSTSIVGTISESVQSLLKINHRHLLRAITSRLSWMKFHHMYTNIGQYNVTVKICTEFISSCAEDTFLLSVVQGIDMAIIDSEQYDRSGANTTFNLLPHKGSNVVYMWNFGDGFSVNTTSRNVVHIYSQSGIYNVSVTASNDISSKENMTTIIIEDCVENITVQNLTARTNVNHSFPFRGSSGSDFTCSWDFGDTLVSMSKSDSVPITGGQMLHLYATSGLYAVKVNCSNHVCVDVFSYDQKAQDAITGLDVVKKGGIVGEDIRIDFFVLKGTDVHYKIFLDNQLISINYYDNVALTGYTAKISGASSVGILNLTIDAWNLVSHVTKELNFTIEAIIVNASSTADKHFIKRGESVTFTGTAGFGTSISIHWYYKDGTPDDQYTTPPLSIWPSGQVLSKTHAFMTVGIYNVEVVIKNNFNESVFIHPIDVYSKVGNLTFNSNDAVEFINGQAFTKFWFITDLDAPFKTKALFDWGDGNTMEYSNIGVFPTVYTHYFTATKNYTVRVNVSNILGFDVYTTSVMVEDSVENLRISMSPAHVINNNVVLGISMDKGSDVTFTVDWDDGSPLHQTKRTGVTSADIDNVSHVYTTVGIYNLKVTAKNNIGNKTDSYTVHVQNPVLPVFNLTSSPPTYFIPGNNNEMTFTLTYPEGLTLPTDVSIIIDPGDGSNKTTLQLPFYSQAPGPYSFQFNHSFPLPGAYVVSVTVKNLASNHTFPVQVAYLQEGHISNPYSTVERKVILKGESINFTAGVESGVVLEVLWQFKDGSPDEHDLFTPFNPFPVNESLTKTHKFDVPGSFDVDVTIKNNVNTSIFTHSIDVYNKVANLTLHSPGAVEFANGVGFIQFWFTTAFEAPTKASILFNWGDGTTAKYDNFEMWPTLYNHTFTASNSDITRYTVTAHVSNLISTAVYSTVVMKSLPVVNLNMILNPSHVILNKAVTIAIHMEKGSGVALSLNWMDGSPVQTWDRVGVHPWDMDNRTHIYTNTGAYAIQVTASTLFGNTTKQYTIFVQHPVTDDFNLVGSPPKFFNAGGINQMFFTLTYPTGFTLPSNASIYIDFGDGSTQTIPTLPFITQSPGPYSYVYSHIYAIAGGYDASFTIKNYVSEKSFQVHIGLYVSLNDAKGNILWQRYLGAYEPGLSINKDHFRLDKPLIFNMSSTGTAVKWKLLATLRNGNDTMLIDFPDSVFYLVLTKVGTWDIVVTAWNALQKIDLNYVIVMFKAPVGLSIKDNGLSVKPGTIKELAFAFEHVSSDTCLIINWVDNQKYLYANDSTCATTHGMTIAGSLSKYMKLKHIYINAGLFTIKANASNSLWYSYTSHRLCISMFDCNNPNLTIENNMYSTDFNNPIIHRKSETLHIISYVSLNCSISLANKKQWTIEKLNNNLRIEKTVDISSRSTSYSLMNPELTIPALVLDIGLYCIRFYVKMTSDLFVNDEDFSHEIYTYIRVVHSELIAALAGSGMSLISRGYNVPVMLNATKFSKDPDVESSINQGFDKFEWKCMDVREFMDTKVTPLPLNEAALTALGGSDKGGCFKQGNGPINTTSEYLNFTTAFMRVSYTYQFNLTIHKGGRSAFTLFGLTILPQDPPRVNIRCKITGYCKPQSDGLHINPSYHVKLDAYCESGCDPELKYEWSMYRKGLVNAWILMEDFANYVTGLPSSGAQNALNSYEIGIDPKLFGDGYSMYDAMHVYRIHLKSIKPNGIAGEVYTILRLNQGPRSGKCSINSTFGIALQDYFKISCSGWKDPDGISKYKYYAIFKGDDITKEVNFSHEHSVVIQLTNGPLYNNCTMEIVAKIYDRKGAFTKYNIGQVQVLPPSDQYLKNFAEQIISDDKNEINKVSEQGNLLQANMLFHAVASSFNTMTVYDREAYVDVPIASKKTLNGYGSTYILSESCLKSPSVKYIANGSHPVEEKFLASYQAERNQKAEIRTRMAQAIESMTVETIGDMEVALSALADITFLPEELNRDGQISTINSVLKIKKTLDNLALSTPVEDLKAVATKMLAVIGNGFEASRFSLMDPTTGDIKKTKLTPYYEYDSDWESISESFDKLSLNVVRRDFSIEANTQHQYDAVKNMAPGGMTTILQVLKHVEEAMVVNSSPYIVTTPHIKASIYKNAAANMTGHVHDIGNSSIDLPTWCNISSSGPCDSNEVISLTMTSTPTNIFGYIQNDYNVPYTSGTVTMDIHDKSGTLVDIANTKKPITIVIQRFASPPPSVNYSSQLPNSETNHLFFHSFNVTRQNASLHLTIKPEDRKVQFLVLIRYGEFPTLNRSNVNQKAWDVLALVPRNINQSLNSNSNNEDAYNVFVDNIKMAGYIGKVVIGLRQLETSEFDKYSDSNLPPIPQRGIPQLTTSYTISLFTSGCYFFPSEQINALWRTNHCKVLKETTFAKTYCECNHLTTYGGGFFVEPNVIDFNYVFSNMDFAQNVSLYMTEITIFVIYICVAIWARRADNKDVIKSGVTPLADNIPEDKYLYEILVGTGLKSNSATNSKVHLILSGDFDETNVRILEDSKRPIFRRGALDRFLLSTERPLGPVQYARIWHDNSGKGKYQGWYARFMIVHDLQTKEKFYFIINQWFAVEEGDSQIERVIQAAEQNMEGKFYTMFSDHSQKQLSDQHVWFSVLSRPTRSWFTRLERVSCCLCILYTSMLGNAMFYDKVPEPAGQNGIQFGPFSFSTEQIYVGVICNLIVFPLNFLLVAMFRKSRPRNKRKSELKETIENSPYANLVSTKAGSVNNRVSPMQKNIENQFGNIMDDTRFTRTAPLHPIRNWNTDGSGITHHKRKKPFTFPWWCRILGWILLILIVLVCTAFVTFYGIMFGDDKCKKWLTSMVISVITSVFVTQPIKIFLVALIFSLLIKKVDLDNEIQTDEEEVYLKRSEKWLHYYPDPGETPKEIPRRNHIHHPPDPKVLEKARKKRIKEIQMYDILREIIFYSSYMWILVVVSYNFRDPHMHIMKTSLESTVIDKGLGKIQVSDADNDFKKVLRYSHFFNWLNNTLVPGIRAGKWYNGANPFYQRGMIGDRVNRIMGYATLRQLRIKNENCDVASFVKLYISRCKHHYNIYTEDTNNYGVGWEPLVINSTWNNSKPEYSYKTGPSLDSHAYWARDSVYEGGGYLTELRGSERKLYQKIEELRQDEWINDGTRAVFIEFTVYNANVNLFGIVTLVAEFLPSGGILTSYRIEPTNLLKNTAQINYFIITCEITLLIFTLFFIVKEIRKLVKQRCRYFKHFWNWVEICTICITIGAVVIYFYRWFYAKSKTELFKVTSGNAYMKFQVIGYWNEVLTYFLGMLCFLGSIKFIRILRFNKKIGMLSATLRYASVPLFWFFIAFMVVFMAFSMFFYKIYHHRMANFRTLLITFETLSQMLVGKFHFISMQEANPIMGPLIFFFYVITVYYVLINMFITIINDSFAQVRADVAQQANDHEMVEFVFDKFKMWTGLENIFNLKEDAKKLTNQDTIEDKIQKFPNQIDKLLEKLMGTYECVNHFRFTTLNLFLPENKKSRQDRINVKFVTEK